MSRGRCAARGVPGGYRIWDDKGHRWWGGLCELCPADLLTERDGPADQTRVTALPKRYRSLERQAGTRGDGRDGRPSDTRGFRPLS